VLSVDCGEDYSLEQGAAHQRNIVGFLGGTLILEAQAHIIKALCGIAYGLADGPVVVSP
jgi:hypothetical protein